MPYKLMACLQLGTPLKIPADNNENPTYSIAGAVVAVSGEHLPSTKCDVRMPLAHCIAALYALANRASLLLNSVGLYP